MRFVAALVLAGVILAAAASIATEAEPLPSPRLKHYDPLP